MRKTPTWLGWWNWANDTKKYLDQKKQEELDVLLWKENESKRDESIEIKDFHKKNENEVRFRENMWQYIQSIKWTDAFWLGKIIRFHYLKWWDVGVVLKFETEDSKIYVFKTSLDWNDIKNEAEAGIRRSKQWADVRTIITQWDIDMEWKKHQYIILPYINEPINHGNLNKEDLKNIYKQIWENMALMNNVKWEWFGDFKIINWKLIWTEKIFKPKKKIKINEKEEVIIKDYLIDNNIFERKYLESILDKCMNIINLWTQNWENTSLLHKDLSFANMFIISSKDGLKVLVSDTAASLWHPMDSLWLTIAKNAYLNNNFSEKEQDKIKDLIILWYKNNWWVIDENIMNASVFLSLLTIWVRAYTKWSKERSEKVINLAKKIAEKI